MRISLSNSNYGNIKVLHLMKIYPIFICFILLSLSVFASEVYRCENTEGKIKYSDKRCSNGESQERLGFKDIHWTKALDANKPTGTKIIEITNSADDTIVKYAFSTRSELNAFMTSAHKLSGLNVNLLKYKAPSNGIFGEAVMQITSKENKLFND